MVRRWSYLKNYKPSQSANNLKFTNTYFRKTFKSTVRFKKFSRSISKMSRKKYNFRKIVNSSYNFLAYAFYWTRVYKLISKESQSNNKATYTKFKPNFTRSSSVKITMAYDSYCIYLYNSQKSTPLSNLNLPTVNGYSTHVFSLSKQLRRIFIIGVLKNL